MSRLAGNTSNDDEGVVIPSMATSMLNHGFRGVMDTLLSEMVWDYRENIHEIVEAILVKRKRIEGKGRMKNSNGGGSKGGPEHTKRPPKMTPTAAQIRHISFTLQPSRSDMEDILERRNCVSTYGKQWEEARASCRAAVQRVIDEGKRLQSKFFDESFYFDKREVMYPEGAPADCSVAEPRQCDRLQFLYPKAVLFIDTLTPDDITQGEVGDCFFIGAVSALTASDPTHLQDLFVHHDRDIGVYGLVFYKCGGWEWVIVDDYVPYVKERSGGRFPLYASASGSTTELWPIILEKAYAKVHYNWSTIDGGWAKEALIDMTGGTADTLDFTDKEAEMPFDRFNALVQSEYTVLACSVPESVKESAGGAAGRAGEASALFGLFKGHQYAVIDTKLTSDGVGFVKCRNPWGNEAEWKGPYSDNSIEWTRNPKHKKEIDPKFQDDGEFWMKFTDFKKYLGIVDVVTTYPDSHNIITMFGSASTDLVPENTYVLQVCGAAADIAITLCQDDPKIKYGKINQHDKQFATYASLKFTVYKMREIPTSHDDLREHMQGKLNSKIVRERANCMAQRFEPGAYLIVPSVQLPKGQESDQLGVYFRVFGSNGANFALSRPYDKSKPKSELFLVVGNCPSIDLAKGKGPEVLKALASPFRAAGDLISSAVSGAVNVVSGGAARNKATPGSAGNNLAQFTSGTFHSDPSIIADPAAAVEMLSTMANLKNDLDESKAYVARLEAMLAEKQARIDSLSEQQQVIARPLSVPSPSPPDSSRRNANNPAGSKASDDTAWGRLGMSQPRLEELINIVFMELSGGGDELSLEDAVNGVRLLVTTGTGLDDIAYGNPVAQTAQAQGSRVDVAGFAKLCRDSILQWEAVGKH